MTSYRKTTIIKVMLLRGFREKAVQFLRHLGRYGDPDSEFQAIEMAFDGGDDRTVLQKTSRILSTAQGFGRLFSSLRSGSMLFNSAEEYNNFISMNPQKSHVCWEFPVQPEAHFHRALVFGRNGRLLSSCRELQQSLRQFPDSAKYLVELGLVQLEMQDYVAAGESFRQACANDLTSDKRYCRRAIAGLGQIALDRGDLGTARDYFIRARKYRPSDPEILNQLQLTQEMENDPRQLAEFLLARSSFEQAVKVFSEALAINIADYQMQLGIAYAYKELEQLDAAEYHIKKAFIYCPGASETNFALGWVYVLQEKFDKAEIELRKAIQKNRFDPVYYYGLASLYFNQVKMGLAEAGIKLKQAIRQALELDVTYADPYLLLANFHFHCGKHRDAILALGKALKYAPKTQAVHVVAAEIYNGMGKRRQAIFHLREASDFGRDTEEMRDLRSRLDGELP